MTTQVTHASSTLMGSEKLAYEAVQKMIDIGVREFCFCPGSRNSPFVQVMRNQTDIKLYFWPEERSAAYFALGRAKSTELPVAVIVTSGSAAGELLPSAMEAYYSGIPLLLVTADRPRRYRGSGAPQSAEQVGLFGPYAVSQYDVAAEEPFDLSEWQQEGPCHLNICIEEPIKKWDQKAYIYHFDSSANEGQLATTIGQRIQLQTHQKTLSHFIESVTHPFVLVSTLKESDREAVAQFLLELNAPAFLEGNSGLREDSRLEHLRIRRSDNIWKKAEESGYSIDGILRIGGVPTPRLWRDLEDKEGKIHLCSIGENPFSGISWSKDMIEAPVANFLSKYPLQRRFDKSKEWIESDKDYWHQVQQLFLEEPSAEPSLIYQLSRAIPMQSRIYLGNSLPIREWNLAATSEKRDFSVYASRGVNGIDGQISTFLGLCSEGLSNWGIFGDLTTLYDMVAPWVLEQLNEIDVNIVVINNGGGKIFAKMYEERLIQNLHHLNFEPLAKMWSLPYSNWKAIPVNVENKHRQFIEIVPEDDATERFWKKMASL